MAASIAAPLSALSTSQTDTLRLLNLALDDLDSDARLVLADFTERAIQAAAAGVYEGEAYLALLRDRGRRTAYKAAAGIIHGYCRDAGAAANDSAALLPALRRRILQTLHATTSSHRPQAAAASSATVPGDGEFILHTWASLAGRGCRPDELHHWQLQLASGAITRAQLQKQARAEADAIGRADRRREATDAIQDPGEFALHVMGTGERVTHAQWRERVDAAPAHATVPPATAAFHLRPGLPTVRISAIASLYRGAAHIERFLANITAQTCFADYAELIIIDAASPDGERAAIERYLPRHPNIRYLRTDTRIGIYEAWNRAVAMARGEYITNTNVDDLRRADSFELQAAALDSLPFVDVVYQDFLYTFNPDLPWDHIAAAGCQSRLPLITPATLLQTNPPHNAPMWRRRLHDDVGLFDTRYESAADYDFWLRCLGAGKQFYKLNDTHVVYYQNPQGVSTRADTRGHAETRDILRRHAATLLPTEAVMNFNDFCTHHLAGHPVLPLHHEAQDRQALVRQALLGIAYTHEYPSVALGTRAYTGYTHVQKIYEPGTVHLAVDAAVFQPTAPGTMPSDHLHRQRAWWVSLLAVLAHEPGVQLLLLDRGDAPTIAGVLVIPHPSYRLEEAAADSVLLQQICETFGAQVFLSTTHTTPLATPTVRLEAGTYPDLHAPAALRDEYALADATAAHHVCATPTDQASLAMRHPGLAPTAVTNAITGEAQAVARAIAIAARHTSTHQNPATWIPLRVLQARIAF